MDLAKQLHQDPDWKWSVGMGGDLMGVAVTVVAVDDRVYAVSDSGASYALHHDDADFVVNLDAPGSVGCLLKRLRGLAGVTATCLAVMPDHTATCTVWMGERGQSNHWKHDGRTEGEAVAYALLFAAGRTLR